MWPLGQGQIQTSRQAGGGGGGDGEGASGVRRVVPDEGTVEVVIGEAAPGPAPPVARAVHVAAPKSHARRMYTGAVAQTGWARPSPGGRSQRRSTTPPRPLISRMCRVIPPSGA